MGNDRQIPSDIETYAEVKNRNRLRKEAGLPRSSYSRSWIVSIKPENADL